MGLTVSVNMSSFTLNNGYAICGYQMILAMQRMGIKVPFNDPRAPVLLQFTQPSNWMDWQPGQYRLGYTPWESSELPIGWLARINETDEFWTTSDLCKEWYEEAGVKVPMKVYHHGIDHEAFAPKRRNSINKIKFLHNGSGAPRKGAQQALDAFRAAFGNQDDVQLTLKEMGQSGVRAKNIDGTLASPEIFNNVKVDKRDYPYEELPMIYYAHHAFVCNSAGEGFGAPGLEAIASGMPTILNPAWAPYRDHAIAELKLETKLQRSPWQGVHPGNMYMTNFDSLVESYRYVYNNFDELSRKAYKNSLGVHREYDWNDLTEKAFNPLIDEVVTNTNCLVKDL